LQQKYPEVLAGKPPDVQKADLGDKGVWYRAVVGPPGSREAASSVCVANSKPPAIPVAGWPLTDRLEVVG
jgi:hypothetical protein